MSAVLLRVIYKEEKQEEIQMPRAMAKNIIYFTNGVQILKAYLYRENPFSLKYTVGMPLRSLNFVNPFRMYFIIILSTSKTIATCMIYDGMVLHFLPMTIKTL